MTLRELAERVGGWVAPEVHETQITGLASLADANPGDLSFFGNAKYVRALRRSRATAVLVPHGFGEEIPAIRVWVDDPAKAFAGLLPAFTLPPIERLEGIHPTAVVSPEALLGEGVAVGPCAVIESGASIGARSIIEAGSYVGHEAVVGEDCRLFPRVVLGDRCRLGNRVVLHSGVVIGADGFGYEFREGRHVKIPQTGIVQIDDDVEIGANTTVDRARFGRTWIQKGTKIDNLVQIAHNVTIGEHCILCAEVGISGSTRIGNYVTLAGKVGISGHVEIGDRVIALAMAGIAGELKPGEVVGGLPARPVRDYKRQQAHINRIEKLVQRVAELEERIGTKKDA